MMKVRGALLRIGEIVFDYIVLSILLTISLILVIPFFYVFVGIIGYFNTKRDSRSFAVIFKTIKENFKLISLYTLFNLIIIIFASANIYFIEISQNAFTQIVVFIAYILLIIDLIVVINAPCIILNMNVTFMELLRNCFGLIYTHIGYFLLNICSTILVVFLLSKFIWMPLVIIYPLCFVNYILTKLALDKARKKINSVD